MRLNPNGSVSDFPKLANLPHISGTPQGAAWFWGGDDELGRLNLLTSQRIAKATRENVRTGDVISLDLPLTVPGPSFFGRKSLEHTITSTGKGEFDDEIAINTQNNPNTGCHYNGVASDDIMGELNTQFDNHVEKSTKLGIDAWAKHGIVGRGVLLDIYGWAQKSGNAYNPFTTHHITSEDLLACAKAQNIVFETGDILLVRTGWLHKYFSLTTEERSTRSKSPFSQHTYVGLEASDSMKTFLHDTYFAAAACDNANFEAWPSPPKAEDSLHACLLPLWGMPIGELWDLEKLTKKCQELERWTFLLTSKPSMVPGGVGSPPNALAMF
ncbi:hypothetical protein IQ07DRAFT_515458 [Pyrenochaeta sp. DS3sAY3a]|nr:hypothetical protein IQ07DRAFT_515458 [Pyrenochaeta sp. DS3sAY3a]